MTRRVLTPDEQAALPLVEWLEFVSGGSAGRAAVTGRLRCWEAAQEIRSLRSQRDAWMAAAGQARDAFVRESEACRRDDGGAGPLAERFT